MGLSYCGVKLHLDLWRSGFFKEFESVIDMGAQELHLEFEDLVRMLEAYGIFDYDKKTFNNLKNFLGYPRCSTRPFYELLGIDKYSCIDLNKDYGAIPHDLNLPLRDKSLFGRFDLVTDYGCNEHVFNIVDPFRTMHKLCKRQGIMVIIQAAYNGNGYFNFDPSFFEGMAAANGYNILFSSYVIPVDHKMQYHIPLSEQLLKVIDIAQLSEIGICYVFQKTSASDFIIPYPGTYMSKHLDIVGFQIQNHLEPPMRAYIPVIRPDDLRFVRAKDLLKIILFKIKSKMKRLIH
jgi:hypothetical protein